MTIKECCELANRCRIEGNEEMAKYYEDYAEGLADWEDLVESGEVSYDNY